MLTPDEAFNRAKNWLHTQFGSHTRRDIWEKLTPDDIRELAAEFQRLTAAQQWRPIETAPKHGAFVCAEGDRVGIALWAGESGHGTGLYLSTFPEGLNPTDWRPLPPPPTQEKRT